jgi:hypothetical protein
VPRILDLGRRRWVFSFMPQPLYHRGESPRYPLDRRLGGVQNRFGRGGEEKNSQPPPGIKPPNPGQICTLDSQCSCSSHSRVVFWRCLVRFSCDLRDWLPKQRPLQLILPRSYRPHEWSFVSGLVSRVSRWLAEWATGYHNNIHCMERGFLRKNSSY